MLSTTTTITTTCMPNTYDQTLYPNLMRYRSSQAQTTTPPPPLNNNNNNNNVPHHPLELLPNSDEWRRCPWCLRSKLCVVIGRCVVWGQRAKVVIPEDKIDCERWGCAAQ